MHPAHATLLIPMQPFGYISHANAANDPAAPLAVPLPESTVVIEELDDDEPDPESSVDDSAFEFI